MDNLELSPAELENVNVIELIKRMTQGKSKTRLTKEKAHAIYKEIDEWAKQEQFNRVVNRFKDDVNHPDHYTSGGIETIDYMKAKSTPEEFRGHLRLTTIKYLSRAGLKDDTLKDLKKAQWYLTRLIEFIEKGE